MIDPLHSLAFSVQANRGVYALLLGSGVSRAAQVPTGWEITLELVRRLAYLQGETTVSDPASWYRTHYNDEPDYSKLLNELANTPEDRQQLLRPFLEPSDEERAQGLKAPTAAHRAIAKLVAKGYVRVIITTNFDRLMETALAEVGVVSTILSSSHQVHGAMPLIHTGCCVLKVHGDYMDTRILNTAAELATYPAEFDTLLDRIFDEFGLIVCGWSAGWDPALRAALERVPSRRFSHFWAVQGEPGDAAKQLITHRQAQAHKISDADSFFTELGRLVESLEQFSRPHPLSTEAAVASLKRYLAEPKHRIELADLLDREIDRVLQQVSAPMFNPLAQPVDTETFTARIRAYEAACETLVAMAANGGYWADDWNYPIWQGALKKLSAPRGTSGFVAWTRLQLYPATLLLYALGLGSMEAGERGLLFLGQLLSTSILQKNGNLVSAVELVSPFCLFKSHPSIPRLLENTKETRSPLNYWLQNMLKHPLTRICTSDENFHFDFCKLEIIISLKHHYINKNSDQDFWTLPGTYADDDTPLYLIIGEIRESLLRHGDESPYIKGEVFGKTVEECIERLKNFQHWAIVIQNTSGF